VHAPVDGFVQTRFTHQLLRRADTAAGRVVGTLGPFLSNVTGGKHEPRTQKS